MSNHKENIKPVDAQHITECLDNEDDFAFEMQVLNLLQTTDLAETKMKVEHTGTYIDPITSFPRQYDIRAEASWGNRDKPTKHVRLAIECKRLKPSSPIVISQSAATNREIETSIIKIFSPYPGRVKSAVVKAQSSLYRLGSMVGRSVSQFDSQKKKPGNDSDIYTRWAQALASLEGHISGCKDYENQFLDSKHKNADIMFLPMACLIVPDEVLWTVNYEKDGSRKGEPTMTNHVHFYVGREYKVEEHIYRLSNLHIMTLSGLSKFLSNELASDIFWEAHLTE